MATLEIVKDTTQAPFRNIIHLETKRRLRAFKTGSAFFIHPQIVLTAGHNIFSPFGNKVNSMWLTPGQQGELSPFETISLNTGECRAQIETHPDYVFNDPQDDIGIVRLSKQNIDELLDWQYHPDFIIDPQLKMQVGEEIFVCGYPAEQEHDISFDGDVMVLYKGKVSGIDREFIEYNVPVEKGNSGSPVWVEREGKRILVGVHSFASGATALTGNNLKWLLKVIKQ